MEKNHSLAVFILIFLLQVILNNSVMFSIYVYLVPICFVILSFDARTHPVKSMAAAFILGILIDFLSNGVPGLHASALTAMAFFRTLMLDGLFSPDYDESGNVPSVWNMGAGNYLIYSMLSCLVFFVFYVFLESMGVTGILFDLKRIFFGVLSNTVLMMLFSAAIHRRRKRF